MREEPGTDINVTRTGHQRTSQLSTGRCIYFYAAPYSYFSDNSRSHYFKILSILWIRMVSPMQGGVSCLSAAKLLQPSGIVDLYYRTSP